ncbi:DUF2268 domain-containing protein [Anaerosacchariphilus polymeriproducens]|uniref:Zn-dependent protease n=1 Tax=Anaerosacchariphilus polymeriproducens TaxID=1812858 RepID=A0A371AXJ2_9FIRM|nr:DUF2268 domain-containing protein [Anaerosacchariphilus polymeriproducens]RDU24200.1 Zn-dependent protease [Anaerosacchariphilus polymeriproducens]
MNVNVTAIRSDKIYRKMIAASDAEREDIYRYELMKPFEFKWQCIGVPLKADQEGGYDAVAASVMGGSYHPSQIIVQRCEEIEKISADSFWEVCQRSIQDSLGAFEKKGINLTVQNYIFTILLNDPKHPMSKMTGDYCGDGGIPGFIIGTIIPNEKSLKMLPVALAHETNHNVRWQFMQWSPKISLADMIVSEGLAENFAANMFGEDKVGIWVKNTSKEVLKNRIKPEIKKNLYEEDFQKISAYLYGDDIMKIRGAEAVGMPYCAGYACGYELVKQYLKKTGTSIYHATITPTAEIMSEMKDFW